MTNVHLQYGANGEFDWQPAEGCRISQLTGPDVEIDLRQTTTECLAQPLELPPLNFALVSGDRVVLAVERNVPLLDHVVAAVWSVLADAGVSPGDVLILQPAGVGGGETHDPRSALPPQVRNAMGWKIHDPTADDSSGYLASSASGERIYLARQLLDADFVLTISRAGFDAVLGFQPPSGVLYPGLSNLEAFKKTHGLGHQELQPRDERPLRQLVNEVGWLLGVQYAVQVVPSARRGQGAEVIFGSSEAVARRASQVLERDWQATLPERIDTVIVAIPTDQQSVSWSLLGTALHAAKALVERGGRIIVLSDLAAPAGPGIELITQQRSPKAALQPLRSLAPIDLQAATQLAAAADWAKVYLLSGLDSQLVEELFCTPLTNEAELARLLETVEDCAVLRAAQFTHGEIAAE